MKCQHAGCPKDATCRIYVSAIHDANACDEHAKGAPIHYRLPPAGQPDSKVDGPRDRVGE